MEHKGHQLKGQILAELPAHPISCYTFHIPTCCLTCMKNAPCLNYQITFLVSCKCVQGMLDLKDGTRTPPRQNNQARVPSLLKSGTIKMSEVGHHPRVPLCILTKGPSKAKPTQTPARGYLETDSESEHVRNRNKKQSEGRKKKERDCFPGGGSVINNQWIHSASGSNNRHGTASSLALSLSLLTLDFPRLLRFLGLGLPVLINLPNSRHILCLQRTSAVLLVVTADRSLQHALSVLTRVDIVS